MRGVALLGATGSIGDSTLSVLALHPDRYRLQVVAARRNVPRMLEICRQFRPPLAVLTEPAAAAELRAALGAGQATQVLAGHEVLEQVVRAPEVDVVVAGIVGAAGLASSLAAAQAGKTLLLANKEALVMAGALFMDAVRQGGATLIPIDSETNAMFQCLPAYRCGEPAAERGVRRLLLTASGGPFLRTAAADMARATPDQACAHPRWVMGRKISVDSATLMNKGLEVIESAWLFGLPGNAIEVVVHPQSVVHSLVEYCDGSLLAQLASPDMRVPIAHALAWPQRQASGAAALNLFDVARLDFELPDRARFPCLDLAYRALRDGGTAGAILNAANEIAVQAFLDGRLAFGSIAEVVGASLDALPAVPAESLETVLAADAAARRIAMSQVQSRC
ncbi:1-deoxy-D-xylulose-5-phosphate reductoisomerase [Immundisolibacter sp.]|uniref:1-deoxy-D-xylulose-5-phosphate reductoisomerase n=1 Tax=Immundisolibacter sp. TaxID=1934948 RepID=UPI002B14C854|nr:1-deoxy-D-xylulose-5-phosphate reductoisomerase [Immundisolibacter sp.]MEA3220379.1 1-deoxy-D-xylulose 5-phosphate reductoisomerase [Immundisolibacter sp.]